MSILQVLGLCWLTGIIGFVLGCAWRWLWTELTDGEIRLAHHVRESDEHEDLTK